MNMREHVKLKSAAHESPWEEDILRTRPHESAALRRLSKKGRRVDALALRAEERRDKLRKATGSRKQAGIRRYLNGETRLALPVTV